MDRNESFFNFRIYWTMLFSIALWSRSRVRISCDLTLRLVSHTFQVWDSTCCSRSRSSTVQQRPFACVEHSILLTIYSMYSWLLRLGAHSIERLSPLWQGIDQLPSWRSWLELCVSAACTLAQRLSTRAHPSTVLVQFTFFVVRMHLYVRKVRLSMWTHTRKFFLSLHLSDVHRVLLKNALSRALIQYTQSTVFAYGHLRVECLPLLTHYYYYSQFL